MSIANAPERKQAKQDEHNQNPAWAVRFTMRQKEQINAIVQRRCMTRAAVVRDLVTVALKLMEDQ